MIGSKKVWVFRNWSETGKNCVSAAEKPESDSDIALVDAINRGEMSAFEKLYGRYRDWVYQLAFRSTNSHADAQDVLQETFSYLVRKFPGFELRSSMKTFLFPAVRNYSIAIREKRKRSVQDDAALAALETSARSSCDHADLVNLVESIPEAQRQVLLMRYVDGMSMAEIAEALDIPIGTVKSRLHHAIKALRDSPRARAFFEK